MKNPRVMGIPPLVLGLLMLQSSASGLLGASYTLADLSWLMNVPGAVFGLAATVVGIALVLQLDQYVMGRADG
ncbi:hypothetical protein [Halorientalis pallida]|uniref:Uncharacterized protein n=1 Tax=Halorientalis pallida TaxID=2479928 RepID=A0A498KT72_9EURY|nr:hypothetical protein [Halorientalis pallida]RXK47987.1 hypothetical protein EAF64_15250 [Halorientalis pallida]